ncbi:MAG TPA: glycosyltransferase family 1 protein [Bacteroidota bacterium]
MKILYDHQIFERHRVGGISRYFADLLAQLTATGDASWDLALRFSDNQYLDRLPSVGAVRSIRGEFQDFCGGLRFRGKRRLYDAYLRWFPARRFQNVNREESLRKIAAGDFDLFHPTYYDPYFLEAIGAKPFVLTIHDMIPELYCEQYPLDDPTAAWKRMLVGRAAGIIAVSENTKKDLVEILGVSAAKVTVVHHGTTYAPAASAPSVGALPALSGRYLLYIGTREGYKNLYFFLLATADLFAREEDLSLVCTGHPFTGEEMEFLRSLGLADRVLFRAVNEQDLPAVYAQAAALIFPSLYEGFGFPVLEAFACNCPVIASAGSSLPEVAGDAAVYIEPKNPLSIRSAVTRVLHDATLRAALVRKGAERVKCFTVPAMADRTVQFYRQVLEGRTAA